MKVSVYQSSLMKAFTLVKDAVAAKSTLPVLGNVLLATDNGRLKLSATDLGIGINAWVPASIEAEGAITLPARLLGEFVSSLPAVAVSIDVDTRTQSAKLKAGKTTATIKGIDAEEFPHVGKEPSEESIDIDALALRRMIDSTVFAAAADQSRPTLTGIETRIADGRMMMAATDGYRLSVSTVPAQGEDTDAIIPSINLRTLGKILDPKSMEDGAIVRMTIENETVCFRTFGEDWNVELVSATIGAKFPDYTAIIPKTSSTKATVNVAALAGAVRTAKLFARENSNIVRLRIQDGAINVLAQGAESGDSTHIIDAEVAGELLETSYNADYLIAALSATSANELTFQFTKPNRPCKIEHGDWMHVIMPMVPPRQESK